MKICYNSSAMIANNALNRNDNRLTASLQRLSSGLKVVEAKDNPAGMAMGKRMNAQLRGISVASQNSSDAISVIETADGALSEVHSILQRMNELAVKASNGTMGPEDRATIQDEIKQLKEEITRIADDTQFNGEPLLNGNYDLKGYTNDANVKVGYYSDEVTQGYYQVNGFSVQFDDNGNIIPGNNFADVNIDLEKTIATLPDGTTQTIAFPQDAAVTGVRGNIITITSNVNADFEMNFKITPPTDVNGNTVAGAVSQTVAPIHVEITGIGAMTMQTGSNEGQTLDIRIPTIALAEMGLESTDMSTPEGAMQAIEDVKYAIQYVSNARSRLGAYQNRLEHSISNLDITDENMTAAYSRIMDVDMAEEMTEYTTVQVISQASMSMLAQANERPAQVLQLLQ